MELRRCWNFGGYGAPAESKFIASGIFIFNVQTTDFFFFQISLVWAYEEERGKQVNELFRAFEASAAA